jgi:hypothetical protein
VVHTHPYLSARARAPDRRRGRHGHGRRWPGWAVTRLHRLTAASGRAHFFRLGGPSHYSGGNYLIGFEHCAGVAGRATPREFFCILSLHPCRPGLRAAAPARADIADVTGGPESRPALAPPRSMTNRRGICKYVTITRSNNYRGGRHTDRATKQPPRALPTLHMFHDLETCGMTSEPIIIRTSCRRPSCRRPSCAAALHDATTNLHYSADTWLAPRHPGR